MKKLLLSLIFSTLVFGFVAQVKDKPLEIIVNNKIQTYKPNSKINLESNDIICIIKGDGKVEIVGKNYKKQLFKKGRICAKMPVIKKSKTVVESVSNNLMSLILPTKEKEVSGTSRDTKLEQTFVKDIIVDKNYLLIKSNKWKPLPITLTIYNTQKQIIYQEDSNQSITSFLIPKQVLKSGYIVEVNNSLNDTLLKSKVVIK